MAFFELRVDCHGQEYSFPLTLKTIGYTYRFEVLIEAQTLIVEPDEDGNYRARIEPIDNSLPKLINPELLKAIISKLQSLRT